MFALPPECGHQRKPSSCPLSAKRSLIHRNKHCCNSGPHQPAPRSQADGNLARWRQSVSLHRLAACYDPRLKIMGGSVMRITRRAGLKGLTASAAAVAMPGIVRSEEPEIVIGAPNSLTGGIGEGGQRTVWALQIAIDQINREGGIKSLGGAKLKLIVADTTSENPTQAASVARRMIDQDRATLLVGATASAMTRALQVETEKSRIPLVTNSYADGIVTRGYKYTFKITPQGGGIWNWSMTSAYELWKASKGSPPKSTLIFMSNDAVGLVVQKQLPEHAKTLNLDVPFSQSFQMGLSDPSVAVAPVLRYKPDLIFLGGFTNDIILIIKALRGVGVTAPIFGAGPAGYDSVGKGLGDAS